MEDKNNSKQKCSEIAQILIKKGYSVVVNENLLFVGADRFNFVFSVGESEWRGSIKIIHSAKEAINHIFLTALPF